MEQIAANELFQSHGEAEIERRRLVRICTRITGDPTAAEDLAQETLIEAWRHEAELRNVAARSAWLAGIAGNVCKRWAKRRGRELARLADPPANVGNHLILDEWPDGEADAEVELERQELVELLDRAMALLPPATRDLLLARYVEERPLDAIAGHLGVSEAAVTMRLQRGKLALKQVLTNDLGPEAAAFGLGSDGWEQTRIWCPMCGQDHLRGRLDESDGTFLIGCATCGKTEGLYLWSSDLPEYQGGIKSYKAAIKRLMRWTNDFYSLALPAGAVGCPGCNMLVPLQQGLPPEAGVQFIRKDIPSLTIRCKGCGWLSWSGLTGILRARPEALHFWSKHPRIHTIRGPQIEHEGRPALVNSFASVNGAARIDFVTDAETFVVLKVSEA